MFFIRTYRLMLSAVSGESSRMPFSRTILTRFTQLGCFFMSEAGFNATGVLGDAFCVCNCRLGGSEDSYCISFCNSRKISLDFSFSFPTESSGIRPVAVNGFGCSAVGSFFFPLKKDPIISITINTISCSISASPFRELTSQASVFLISRLLLISTILTNGVSHSCIRLDIFIIHIIHNSDVSST